MTDTISQQAQWFTDAYKKIRAELPDLEEAAVIQAALRIVENQLIIDRNRPDSGEVKIAVKPKGLH